jgi:hypothetical protein
MRIRSFLFSFILTAACLSLLFGRSNIPRAEVVDVGVWPENATIAKGEQVQFYAAFLNSDGTVSCEVPPAALGALYDSGTFVGGCDSATALLDFSLVQDTISQRVRFRWARQNSADEYNIVVSKVSSGLSVLDTIIVDTVLVWGSGEKDSLYYVRGAGRYRGMQAAFGDSVSFGFPGSVIITPVAPIAIDTVQ